MWDRRTDQDAPTDDFDGYLERLSHSGVYAGGLEVLAAARHYKFTAVIIPEDSTLPVMALHLKGTLPRVYFWYTGKHYDLLLLDAGKSLPTSIQDALHESLAAAVPRGGGPGSTASFASTAPSGLKDLWVSQRRDPADQHAQSDHRKTAEFVAVESLPGVSADPAPASSSSAQRVQSPTGKTGTGKIRHPSRKAAVGAIRPSRLSSGRQLLLRRRLLLRQLCLEDLTSTTVSQTMRHRMARSASSTARRAANAPSRCGSVPCVTLLLPHPSVGGVKSRRISRLGTRRASRLSDSADYRLCVSLSLGRRSVGSAPAASLPSLPPWGSRATNPMQ